MKDLERAETKAMSSSPQAGIQYETLFETESPPAARMTWLAFRSRSHHFFASWSAFGIYGMSPFEMHFLHSKKYFKKQLKSYWQDSKKVHNGNWMIRNRFVAMRDHSTMVLAWVSKRERLVSNHQIPSLTITTFNRGCNGYENSNSYARVRTREF